MTTWTDERIELLKHLIEAGKSASEIAGIMRGFSREAICGKAFRQGWPIRAGRAMAAAADREKRKTGITVAIPLVPRPKRQRPSRAKMLSKPKQSAEIQPSLGLTIFELGNHSCRYPDGGQYDPAKTFCGHPVFAHESYCFPHCRICFAAPGGRQWEAA